MDIEVSTPIVAEAEVKKYTLVGDDIYVKRYTNENIPDWYRQLISDIIAGNSQINSLNDAIAYINSWQDGYNVTLSSMQNGMLEVDTKLETLKTSNDKLTAGIGELWITKVDADSASAIARETVGAYFADGSAGAFFANEISTYASAIQANASNVSTLNATLDSQSVRIDTVDSVVISKAQIIQSDTAPTLVSHPSLKKGDLWVNTTTKVTKAWLASTDNGTDYAWRDTTTTVGNQAYTWSATSSKLITNPNGGITGWSFADSSQNSTLATDPTSQFRITADLFELVASSQEVPAQKPFIVNAADGEITLNSRVTFNSTGGSGSNSMNPYYSNFMFDNIDVTNFSYIDTDVYPLINKVTGYIGSSSLEIRALTSLGYVGFGKSDTDYNIVISAHKKWIISAYVYVSSVNSPLTVNNVKLQVQSPADTVDTYKGITSSVPVDTWTRISFVADYSTDASTSLRMRVGNLSFSGNGETILLVDGVMVEEQVGALSSPTTYISPVLQTDMLPALINAGSTTIDGGRITTGSITASILEADAISGQTIRGSSIVGGTIEGTTITGVNITGSVIKTTWIDLSSSGYLTNYFGFKTPDNDGSTYLPHFAKNSDGSYVLTVSPTDPTHAIYYRLPTTLPVTTEGIANKEIINDSGELYSGSYYWYDTGDGATLVWNGSLVYNNQPNGYIYVRGGLVYYSFYKIRRYKWKGVGALYTLPNLYSYNSYLTDVSGRLVNESANMNVIGSTLIFESTGIGQSFGNFTFYVQMDGVNQSKVIEYATAAGTFFLHGIEFRLEVTAINNVHYYKIYLVSLTPLITLASTSGRVAVGLYTNNINYLYPDFSNSTVKTFQFPKLQTNSA